MRCVRNAFVGLTVALLVLGLGLAGAGRVLAQDATPAVDVPPGRPAHIHAGTCDDLDPNPLAPLTDVGAPTGTAAGPADVTPVEVSVTTVPLDLATILAADHSINVHLSQEEADVYIACGEIGGIGLDAAGSLAIGLREQNESGFSGVAYLTPNVADATQTDVSVFLAEGLHEDDEPTDEATEEAAATGDEVAVSLTEFTIDMETELPAGPTTFAISNDGEFPHSFEIEGEGVEEGLEANLEPGESDTLEVDLEPGTYEVYCPVGSHADQGMTLELTVTE
jgi:uncharacterized cupredoxin-like copper-binding protein